VQVDDTAQIKLASHHCDPRTSWSYKEAYDEAYKEAYDEAYKEACAV
jgi:hypothetical protein